MIINQDKGISNELIAEIVSDIKLMENIQEPSKQASDEKKAKYNYIVKLLPLYVKMICQKILDRTNRRVFPKDLKYLVIDMVKDKYESNLPSSDISSLQSVQSMSETGRSVNFGINAVTLSKLNLLVEKQLNEYDTLLGKYRLVYKS